MPTKEQRAAYRQANREQIKAYAKAYREANRENLSVKNKVYREANREKVLAYQNAYAAAHPNEFLANTHKKRAKKAGAKMGDIKDILAWIKGWKTESPVACHYCRVVSPGTDMTIDHFIPMSAGGDHDLNNLVVCCKPCNSSKQDRLPEEWQAFKAAC